MTDLRRGLERRRGTVERARANEGGVYIVEGIIELVGIGEVTVDVRFPVTFVQKPILLGNGGVAENQRIVPGSFPTWDVGVLRWDRIYGSDTPDTPRYRGARLIVVVTGAFEDETTFESEAYWSARGRALTNPITAQL